MSHALTQALEFVALTMSSNFRSKVSIQNRAQKSRSVDALLFWNVQTNQFYAADASEIWLCSDVLIETSCLENTPNYISPQDRLDRDNQVFTNTLFNLI